MRSARFGLGGLLAGIAIAACSANTDVERVSRSQSQLVGGAADNGDPAVGVLDVSNSGECTAEFIATTVLLTAAHCVLNDNGSPLPAGTVYRFYTGPDFNTAPDNAWITIPPANVHPHPGYDGNSHDLAILVLDQPQAVTPFAINTKPLDSSMIGASVRLVGYGQTTGSPGSGGDGFGVKRTLTTTIGKIDSTVVLIGTTGHQACDGDSGGPALMTINGVETIIATDDYAAASVDCTEGDYYMRVDQELAFIQQYLPAAAPDAGQAPVDAGGSVDSGASTQDAGGPHADAGLPGPGSSSSSSGGGGGSPQGDGGLGSNGGQATPQWTGNGSSGCNTSGAAGGSELAWLGAGLALAFARRRRARGGAA